MSGIFGIFNRDGKPVDNEIVNTMLDAMSYWEPDECHTWIDGSVALGHAMLWNTPESKYEHLPLEKDALILTMDARIDNRDELMKELELPDRPIEQIGDSEFILVAYRKWGEECPKYLLGDFAFAIWDDKKKQLFCARDHVGIKQFYYHLSDGLFLFGNDLKVLTQYPNISKEINDESVANYIVNHQLLSNTRTFFEAFEKLPPAHTLTISNKNMKKHCYWRLENSPKVKLPNAEAYAKKLRELLEAAVYARMRSDYPITSHLSGGLDSSSIAVLAARKLKEKGQKLLAFNWLHEPEEGDDATQSEWANSKMIAEMEGIEHHYVTLTNDDMYKAIKENTVIFGNTTGGLFEKVVQKNVNKYRSRIILSGWGGDEFVTYHGQSYYSDILGKFEFKRLILEIKCIIKMKKLSVKSTFGFFYRKVIIPMIPTSLYCYFPKSICFKPYIPKPIKKVLHPLIMKKYKEKKILSLQPKMTIKKHMLAYWKYAHIQSRCESWCSSSIEHKLEYRYPLLDKRILEFSLGVPPHYFVSNGIGRYVYKDATKDLFPKELVWKDYKLELNKGEKLLSLYLELFSKYKKELDAIDNNTDYLDIKEFKDLFTSIDYSKIKSNNQTIMQIIELDVLLNILNLSYN